MDKALVAYWRGKALNAYATYNEESEQLLAKAVKLEPTRVDAWTCLGECFWKKSDLAGAKNCFTGALTHVRQHTTKSRF